LIYLSITEVSARFIRHHSFVWTW